MTTTPPARSAATPSTATPPVDDQRDDTRDGTPDATPQEGREALASGDADRGAAPEGHEEGILGGLGRAIGNIVIGSLPDPGPRDGVASGPHPDAPEHQMPPLPGSAKAPGAA